jgi:Transposase DDE domain
MRQTKKATYRVRNWSQYNAALVKRGSLEVWVDESVAKAWQRKEKTGERGRPEAYKDSWIELILMLGMVYHLPLRQLEGFARSLVKVKGWWAVQVPNFTTLCRRRKALKVQVSQRRFSGAITGVVDSSGAKVYGEGEWKVSPRKSASTYWPVSHRIFGVKRQHGASKRRTWRKFHLAVEPDTLEILNLEVSTNDVTDDEMLPVVLEGVATSIVIKQVCGEGGYDLSNSYQAIAKRKARAVIPPRKDAKIKQHGTSNAPPLDRDQNLRRIRQIGRKRWKQEATYHQRSLAETTVYRYKTIIGSTLNARLFDSQSVEMKLAGKILNRMTGLGLPVSVRTLV